jgi:hypothetical protein
MIANRRDTRKPRARSGPSAIAASMIAACRHRVLRTGRLANNGDDRQPGKHQRGREGYEAMTHVREHYPAARALRT